LTKVVISLVTQGIAFFACVWGYLNCFCFIFSSMP